MAKVGGDGLAELIQNMTALGVAVDGDIARDMLLAGAEVVAESWQKSAKAHGHVQTGAMLESIGAPDGPVHLGNAIAIDIYPKGKDKRRVRNAEKAFILNYGSSRIRADRWVEQANDSGEAAAIARMTQVFNDKINEVI